MLIGIFKLCEEFIEKNINPGRELVCKSFLFETSVFIDSRIQDKNV